MGNKSFILILSSPGTQLWIGERKSGICNRPPFLVAGVKKGRALVRQRSMFIRSEQTLEPFSYLGFAQIKGGQSIGKSKNISIELAKLLCC